MDEEDLEGLFFETEKRFEIDIDEFFAGRTLGDFYQHILFRLGLTSEEQALELGGGMNRARETLAKISGVSVDQIRPESPLKRILPWHNRKASWKRLEAELGVELPSLREWGCAAHVAAVAWVALSALLIWLCAPLLDLLNGGIAELAAIVLFCAAPFGLLAVFGPLAARASRPFVRLIPLGLRTVEDLGHTLCFLNVYRIRSEAEERATTEESVSRTDRDPRCSTPMAFIRLREILVRVGGVERGDVRLDARLEELLPPAALRRVWDAIQKDLGWREPPLTRPKWLTRCALVLWLWGCLVIGWTVVGGQIGFALVGVPLACAAISVIPCYLLFSRVTHSWATCLPPDCATVGEMTKMFLLHNYWSLMQQSGRVEPREVWHVLRHAASECLFIPVDEITEDTVIREPVEA
ncbi:MAG: hypothetical protein GY851_37005 [bacterium]|nr:hypothetical protein [bacterium]